MLANFGSELRTYSLMACRALWIFPSCTAFCTACDGATASTSALKVCEETVCDPRALAAAGAGGGGTLGAGLCTPVWGGGIVGRGAGGGVGAAAGGAVGRGAGVIRTGRLASTAFLYLETLR